MATQQRFITEQHSVDRTQKAILTITIGNDQIGGSTVKFADESVFRAVGQVIGLDLGPGNLLVGRTLLVRTRFFDRNPFTNNVSGTYNFNNGTVPFHVYFDMVQNDDDSFIFDISFIFI